MNKVKTLLNYLFTPQPGNFELYIPVGIFIGFLLIASIVMHYIYKEKKKTDPAFRKLFKKTASHLVMFGIFFLIFALIRYENIPYFAMRIWFYLGLLLFAYFTYRTISKYRTDYPREKHNVHQIKTVRVTKDEKKYLPNKKKR